MHPFIHIFGKEIAAYAVMSLLGILACAIAIYLLNRTQPLRKDQFSHIAAASLLGLLLGGHFLYGITRLPDILSALGDGQLNFSSFHGINDFFSLYFGGLVYFGGLFGALAGGYLYCRYSRLNTRTYMNALAPAIPLFHAFGRIGCFLAGCCYGIASDCGFTYTHALSEAANNIKRFPVQLLESLLEFALFILLAFLLVKFRNRYSLVRIYLLCYSLIRFLDEFLRGDEIRGFLGPFSTSQWISLIILACLAFERIRKRRKLL
ncbi:prolipoprotein diacylglyceryl transferase [Parasporobacterium paucivorans]|uniref:Phosphatidylglycerol:prolipoprotein diacylglycerol transferase n=1 Tax=Parasporobacterium paucivorans DSM 15970 TaxID=1122934 RepID=A0A1M6BBQ6_9FIRM|nr:prolipoprotein diacylglyceryl transferase family protein [Parasporobacterium paucivorans]SHI46152.1 phosphatidylglycerol:prolipoprotein diacylglycerol transferase [Parasporobacterium paucivorans DSM 15970]